MLAGMAKEGGHDAARRAATPAIVALCAGDEQLASRAGDVLVWLGPTSVEPLLAVYTSKAVRLGPVGSGQLAKMANQICIAGLLEALAEGIRFAERAGLDARAVIEAISQGAAGSWQLANRAPSMVERRFDFGFAVDWMRKDLAIALAEARRIGAELPVTALVDRLYGELAARGGGRLDTSSLITLLD